MKADEDYIERLRALAQHPKVVAIGEAGLEYFYDAGPKEKQRRELLRQAELADELGKPLVIHLRDADEDFLQILESGAPDSGILHCFTASEELMRAAVEKRILHLLLRHPYI